MQTKYWIAMFIGAMMSFSFLAGCEDSGGDNGNDVYLVKCPHCGYIFDANLYPAPEATTTTTTSSSSGSSSSGSSSSGNSNSDNDSSDDDNDSPTPSPTPEPPASSSSSSGELPF